MLQVQVILSLCGLFYMSLTKYICNTPIMETPWMVKWKDYLNQFSARFPTFTVAEIHLKIWPKILEREMKENNCKLNCLAWKSRIL